ncbi:MAG: LysE/ArgO family amino acid transporter [Thermoactinomyces vulgaris]|jgi:L-lysine exporter family protein LysE/ArgO|uniref:Amino acid transporter n=1 Tax=Thermoactinomyces vulgaris TaxID=2026 RepID=A0ABS0QJN9_THEVU|nr:MULTISPECIES: LysE/ArgO family amino acid transporter [Thermoactinomyces]KFZ40963.1 LysE family L-lysine exporter [Thermoactinomyces sp. Gus2-1]MBA4552025.1 amino acid transporter [Thermoactinomyces vulgaris]MBA4597485.1 amino acid transporter [Thermoactinomyces vulgaris]MBH8588969.1 amino acid transporter [Thermoactinomyces vulgaris]QCV56169.1 amino acid transporter [Thermoactinomyces vulgaris]
MIQAVIHGIILSFGLILPLGVQNVFVFNQGATQPKFLRALPVVLTASVCDTLLISLAVLGVSVVVFGVYWVKVMLILAGTLFLIYMGWVTFKSQPDPDQPQKSSLSPKKQIAFAVSVSLLNPHAIMDTIGVIGTSSLSYTGVEKLAFTLACVAVSWIWFFSLAWMGKQVGRLHQSADVINMLNKVSAFIMWGTALYLLFTI